MKLPLAASFTRAWMETFCRIRAPSLNLRLLIQLELSVNVMLERQPSPCRRFMVRSPVIRGLRPSLSRMMLELNSCSLQSSRLSEWKSPFRTRIETLAEDRGPLVTLVLVLESISWISIRDSSSASILVPVKTVAGKLLTNLNSRTAPSEVPTGSVEDPDLQESRQLGYSDRRTKQDWQELTSCYLTRRGNKPWWWNQYLREATVHLLSYLQIIVIWINYQRKSITYKINRTLKYSMKMDATRTSSYWNWEAMKDENAHRRRSLHLLCRSRWLGRSHAVRFFEAKPTVRVASWPSPPLIMEKFPMLWQLSGSQLPEKKYFGILGCQNS